MPVDPSLLDILACPSDDHAPLEIARVDGAEVLRCTHCASTFPVIAEIPVLLMDESTPGPNGLGVAAAPPTP